MVAFAVVAPDKHSHWIGRQLDSDEEPKAYRVSNRVAVTVLGSLIGTVALIQHLLIPRFGTAAAIAISTVAIFAKLHAISKLPLRFER